MRQNPLPTLQEMSDMVEPGAVIVSYPSTNPEAVLDILSGNEDHIIRLSLSRDEAIDLVTNIIGILKLAELDDLFKSLSVYQAA